MLDYAITKGRKMVLVIHNVKRNAQAISDIFYYMGVLSCAATPEEALSEISERYRAVIVMNPEALPDAESFVERLRAYDHKIPIFAISDRTAYTNAVFDECFPNDIYSSRLVEEIARFQSERGLPTVSQYRLAGINASCNIQQPSKRVEAMSRLLRIFSYGFIMVLYIGIQFTELRFR